MTKLSSRTAEIRVSAELSHACFHGPYFHASVHAKEAEQMETEGMGVTFAMDSNVVIFYDRSVDRN